MQIAEYTNVEDGETSSNSGEDKIGPDRSGGCAIDSLLPLSSEDTKHKKR